MRSHGKTRASWSNKLSESGGMLDFDEFVQMCLVCSAYPLQCGETADRVLDKVILQKRLHTNAHAVS